MANSSRDPLLVPGGEGNGAEQQDESPQDLADGEKCEDLPSSAAGSSSSSSAWYLVELKKQFWIAAPMICVNLLQYSVNLVSIIFVGHLGELELASASVANSLAGVTGNSVMMGMATTLETLSGQAFGANQYGLVGIYLQRAILVLNGVAIPIAFLWFYMGSVLRAVGQDPNISDYAGRYARWMLPSLFAFATLQPIVKYFQTQSVVLPMTYCGALTVSLHIPICWLLVYKSGEGYRGAAIANSVSLWLNVLFLSIYIKFSPKFNRTWAGFTVEAFNDIKQFLWLALPSASMLCLAWWSFELVVLMAGLLPNPQLETSTLSICLITLLVLFMVPFGLSAAASTRISNELGAGRHVAAKKAAVVATSMGFVEGVVMCSILLSLRHLWPIAFTGEQEVVDNIATETPFLAVLTILDAWQAVLSGVMRGSGMQDLGAYSNLGAYYIVGLPLAILLAFHFHMRSRGLLIGLMTALAFQGSALGAIAYFLDWKKQAQKAIARVVGNQLPTKKLVT